MEKNNMTAVEWIVQEINKISVSREATLFIEKLRKQAKQMEKEHHENTWLDSRVEYKGNLYIGNDKTFEQYYNETYGKP